MYVIMNNIRSIPVFFSLSLQTACGLIEEATTATGDLNDDHVPGGITIDG